MYLLPMFNIIQQVYEFYPLFNMIYNISLFFDLNSETSYNEKQLVLSVVLSPTLSFE